MADTERWATVRRARWTVLLTVLAAVVTVDQAAKWWAWRHAGDVVLNQGGDVFVGATLGGWLETPAFGAVADVLGATVLILGLRFTARAHTSRRTLAFAALVLAGWISNVLDRLGLHRWTAPGAPRGVVDFITGFGETFNLADVGIVIGTFGLAASAARALARGAWSARDVTLDEATLTEPGLAAVPS